MVSLTCRLCILFTLFGISAWLGINSVYSQLPMYIHFNIPEKWAIAADITAAVAVSNFLVIGFLIFDGIYISKQREFRIQKIVVQIGTVAILLFGLIALVLLSQFWNVYTSYHNTKHSCWLIALTVVVGSLDSLSSVLYLPFTARFGKRALVALAFGESLSGCIAGGLGTIQWTNHSSDPLFTTEIFFLIMAAICFVSLLSVVRIICYENRFLEYNSHIPLTEEHSNDDDIQSSLSIPIAKSFTQSDWSLVFRKNRLPLFIQFMFSFYENGMLMSIRTYVCEPYGTTVFNCAVYLTFILQPFAALIAMKYRTSRVGILFAFISILSLMQLVLAICSPNPPLKYSVVFHIVVVFICVFCGCLLSYGKATIYLLIKSRKYEYDPINNKSICNSHMEALSMRLCGYCIQAGSCIGALLFYVLVNYLSVFSGP